MPVRRSGRHRKSIGSGSVPINEEATAALQKYLFSRFGSEPMAPDEPLFPSRLHGMRLKRWLLDLIVRAVLAKAGVGMREAYRTHALRKALAQSVDAESKHDINLTRVIVGHGQVATTQSCRHGAGPAPPSRVPMVPRPDPLRPARARAGGGYRLRAGYGQPLHGTSRPPELFTATDRVASAQKRPCFMNQTVTSFLAARLVFTAAAKSPP